MGLGPCGLSKLHGVGIFIVVEVETHELLRIFVADSLIKSGDKVEPNLDVGLRVRVVVQFFVKVEGSLVWVERDIDVLLTLGSVVVMCH